MCKEEEGLSIKWIFNRTNKFQSCGEIESMHEFEFVDLVNSYLIAKE